MYQLSGYSIIKHVSKTWEFRLIHRVLLAKYGTEVNKLGIVDQFMSMRSDDIYVTFAMCYQSLSRVWLTLGLRPDINKGLQYHDRVMKKVHGMPDDVIDLIASFIPEQNYRAPWWKRYYGDIEDPYNLSSARFLWGYGSNYTSTLDDIPAPSIFIRTQRDDILDLFYNGRHEIPDIDNYDEIPDLVCIDGSIVTRDSEMVVHPRYPGDYVFPPGNNVLETRNHIYSIAFNPINYLTPGRVSYPVYPQYNRRIIVTVLGEPHL